LADPDFPPVAQLLPHRGRMVLLTRVLAHAREGTSCTVAIDAQDLFRAHDGTIASWIGVEYMAQCVAAHAGLIGRAAQREPRVGYLVSSRRLRFHVPRFDAGQTLRVSASQLWGGEQGLVAFQCKVEDHGSGALLVEGRLNCYMPEVP
jgi:predicted hotdog family 3-hydroxylacyl-ACP dehydratase